MSDHRLEQLRDLTARVLNGPSPAGMEFDACRELVRREPETDAGYQALCMLLEGALADPGFDIDATQILVRLLKALARGEVRPGELLP